MDDKVVTGTPPESRFQVARGTLLADVWMGRLIRLGGVGVIAAVIGMLLFLLWQVVPLFSGAEVTPQAAVALRPGAVGFGEDESGEVVYAAHPDGTLRFVKASDGSSVTDWSPPAGSPAVTAVRVQSREGQVLLGHADGSVSSVTVSFKVSFASDGRRSVEPEVKSEPPRQVGEKGRAVTEVWAVRATNTRLFVVRQASPRGSELRALRLAERRGLGGRAVVTPGEPFAIAPDVDDVGQVLVPSTADSVLVLLSGGEVRAYAGEGDRMDLIQSFRPFPGAGRAPSAAGLIFGDVSAVFLSAEGEQRVWAIHPVKQSDGRSLRRWGEVREPVRLPGPGAGVWAAAGNKCYLLAAGGELQLRNLTTGSVRWQGEAPPGSARQVVFSRNYDRMSALAADGSLRRWKIEDHHPDSSWSAFFGRIWYEGADGPAFVWQSSSGSDEFEAKYSLVPLIYGTVKGTFYALLFALPIALLAAVYVSQFLRPDLRLIVKPLMEVMASLPSVVLGFLAGLWLAPVVDANLVPLLCALAALAPAGLASGWIWSRLPQPVRRRARPGLEFLWLAPVVFLCVCAAWSLGPSVESALFTVTDPSGAQVSDLREWWRVSTGLAYDARNSLVVGFVMGFAVIPVVFTIAEDALSNVPAALTSGSLALGASRWQTVWRVVVPTAVSGIVSAVMIGFGRAVGETMIVVMATGNTAVMEANPFNGMRTLSANIAVELPEAPAGHTHFRALFLGACCLFLLTFILNTLAEVLRQRLRERYKVV
jgi:phosphate transport system permease protein